MMIYLGKQTIEELVLAAGPNKVSSRSFYSNRLWLYVNAHVFVGALMKESSSGLKP